MRIIEEKLKRAEDAYIKNKSGARALTLFSRYIMAGKMTDDSKDVYFSKAYHVAMTMLKEDALDVRAIAAALHADMILGNFDSALETVTRLEAHSAFLNKSFPFFHAQILYFYAILLNKAERQRSARKMQKNLELLYEKTGMPHMIALLGSLQRIVFDDDVTASKMYLEAMRNGFRSVFFFLEIYELLAESYDYSTELNELAKAMIPWALANGLSIDVILERLEKRTLIGTLFSLDTKSLEEIYRLSGHVGAFQCLCQKMIFEGRTDSESLAFYVTALEESLKLRGLEQTAIRAAYENKYYDLPTSVIEEAVKTHTDYDLGQLAFLFGILVTRKDISSKSYLEDAVKFGMWAISKGKRGKDFNTIYKFLLDLTPDDTKISEVLFEEVFKHEIEFSGKAPGCFCCYEYAKSGVSIEKVEDGKACFTAISQDFNYYFLSEIDGEYLTVSDYKISKALELERGEMRSLLETLYGKGFKSIEIILALAIEYLTEAELSKNCIDILQMAACAEESSGNLRLDICRRLALHYAKAEQFSIAAHYYGIMGQGAITRELAEGALQAYIATGKYESAVELITKRNRDLPRDVMFGALKILREYANTPEIASLCHELIMNDFCGNEILSILMQNFRGTPDEWIEIAAKIDSLGFDVTQIYEKIITDGIFAGSIGNASVEAFIKLCGINRRHAVIPKFAYFCCYEILKKAKPLQDSLIATLDDLYKEDDSDSLLCLALAVSYIRSGRQDKLTLISSAAVMLEEMDVVFPEFKIYQDKCFISSYIEKNTPFLYFSAAHRNVNFYYRTEENETFRKIKAKYFKFGMYFVNLALFHGERIFFYFEEEGGAKGAPEEFVKTHMRIIEQFNDPFYAINNALIFGQMMKFDKIEELIDEKLSDDGQVDIIMM